MLASLEGCDDPRLKQILGALVTHLHDFVREVQLTEEEWMQGIRFLTATGHMCSDTRQEFILLSDTLGVSMLTVALNQRHPPERDRGDGVRPVPCRRRAARRAGRRHRRRCAGPSPSMSMCVVTSSDGTPLAGAEVDVWQADEDGLYDVQAGTRRSARGR